MAPLSSNNEIVSNVINLISSGLVFANPYDKDSTSSSANTINELGSNAYNQFNLITTQKETPWPPDSQGIILYDRTLVAAHSYSTWHYNQIRTLLWNYQNSCTEFMFHSDARSGANTEPNYIVTANAIPNQTMGANSSLRTLSGISLAYSINVTGNALVGDFGATATINSMFSSISSGALLEAITLKPPPTNSTITIISSSDDYTSRLLFAQTAASPVTTGEMANTIIEELKAHSNTYDSIILSSRYLGRFIKKWEGQDIQMQNVVWDYQTKSTEAKGYLSLAEVDEMKPILKLVGTEAFKEAANLV